jgi:hypothetical protein
MHARYNLFACVGGMHKAHMAGDEGMSKFMGLNSPPCMWHDLIGV